MPASAAQPPLGQDRDWQRVLGFWFGAGDRGSLAERHRRLWFPQEHAQAAADEAVSRRFSSLLEAATRGQLDHWSSAPQSCLALIIVLDQFPRHLYRHAADRPQRLAQSDALALKWCRHLISRRPPLRGDADPRQHTELLQRVFAFDANAEDPADLYQADWLASLTETELGFALLPLRHSRRVPELRLALQLLDERVEHTEFLSQHLERLRSVGLRNLQLEECRAANQDILASQDLFEQAEDASRKTPAEIAQLVVAFPGASLNTSSQGSRDSAAAVSVAPAEAPSQAGVITDILRSVPHEWFRKHPTATELLGFARRHGIPLEAPGGQAQISEMERLAAPDKEFLTDEVVCISLSGGVDSMVICELLDYFRWFPYQADSAGAGHRRARKQLDSGRLSRKQRRAAQKLSDTADAGEGSSDAAQAEADAAAAGDIAQPPSDDLVRPLRRAMFRLVAVHVDYGNREQSAAEAQFLNEWCSRRGISLRLHRMGEDLRRGHTNREDYERLTRQIRFGLYREMLRKYAPHCRGVIFGHHRGDVQENVLANVFKGGSLMELNGMSEVSIIDGVPIWRPLLALDKTAIFDLAHGVQRTPYFKDTTPTYCTRGRTRNDLIPLLKQVYGPDVLNELSRLGSQSEDWRRLVWTRVLRPFLASIRRGSSDWLSARQLTQCVAGPAGAPWESLEQVGVIQDPETLRALRDAAYEGFPENYYGRPERLLAEVSDCSPKQAPADPAEHKQAEQITCPDSAGGNNDQQQFEADRDRLTQIGGAVGTCVWLDLRPWRQQPVIVWQELLRQVLHGIMGVGMVRHHGLDSFLQMLREGPRPPGKAAKGSQGPPTEDWMLTRSQWMTLRSDLRIRLERGILYIFWPELFPVPPVSPLPAKLASQAGSSAAAAVVAAASSGAPVNRRGRARDLEPTIDALIPPGLTIGLGEAVRVVVQDDGSFDVRRSSQQPVAGGAESTFLRAGPWTVLLQRVELQSEFMIRDQPRCSLDSFARTGSLTYLLPACDAGYRLAPGPIARSGCRPLTDIDIQLLNVLPVVDCNLSAQQLLHRHLLVPYNSESSQKQEVPEIAEVWERKAAYSPAERLFLEMLKRRGQGRDHWWKPEFELPAGREQFRAQPWCVRVTAVFAHPPKHTSEELSQQ